MKLFTTKKFSKIGKGEYYPPGSLIDNELKCN